MIYQHMGWWENKKKTCDLLMNYNLYLFGKLRISHFNSCFFFFVFLIIYLIKTVKLESFIKYFFFFIFFCLYFSKNNKELVQKCRLKILNSLFGLKLFFFFYNVFCCNIHSQFHISIETFLKCFGLVFWIFSVFCFICFRY